MPKMMICRGVSPITPELQYSICDIVITSENCPLMTDRIITIALIGDGPACARQALTLEAFSGVQVVLASAEAVREADWFAKVAPDLAALCVPPEQSANLVHHLAASGVALLLPAPLAARLHDAGRIRKSLKRFKVQGMGWHPYRFQPALARLKEMVDSGVLGILETIEVTVGPGDAQRLHSLDVCNWFLGEFRQVEVVEDDGRRILQVAYGGGAVATLSEVEGLGQEGSAIFSVGVKGDLGEAFWEGPGRVRVRLGDRARTVLVQAVEMESVLWGYVLDRIRHGEPLDYVPLKDSVAALALKLELGKTHV